MFPPIMMNALTPLKSWAIAWCGDKFNLWKPKFHAHALGSTTSDSCRVLCFQVVILTSLCPNLWNIVGSTWHMRAPGGLPSEVWMHTSTETSNVKRSSSSHQWRSTKIQWTSQASSCPLHMSLGFLVRNKSQLGHSFTRRLCPAKT